MISFGSPMTKKRSLQKVEEGIHLIRGQRVMFDSDLAEIYGVTTKRLNEQLKRNRQRFPKDFAFQLTRDEAASLRSQIATSNRRGGRRYLPWVFTEHGALMLASVTMWKRPQCRDLAAGYPKTIGALRPLPLS
jgi:hypothetical protein